MSALTAPDGTPVALRARMQKRILVVDDDDDVSTLVGRCLADRGFVVVRAEELEEAEALLLHSEFSVVVFDLKLTAAHGAEGLELLSFLRKHCPFALAILLTGHASERVRAEAIRRGADAVLEKPLGLRALSGVVEGLLAGGAR